MQTQSVPEPRLPDSITAGELDAEARRDLRGLQKETAETVARHLVAAGMLVDEDPELALQHARYARRRASRIAVVREAAGIAAYHAGEWNEALGELRAARRMGGGPGHLAVMADIERALGRPERALEIARGPEVKELGRAETIELTIVVAGARRDLGELDAAVVAMQIPELEPSRRDSWSPRLFYAYADNLLAAGRESDALQWFVHTTHADVNGETDAEMRIAELTGEPQPDDGVQFSEEELEALADEPDEDGDEAAADLADADSMDNEDDHDEDDLDEDDLDEDDLAEGSAADDQDDDDQDDDVDGTEVDAIDGDELDDEYDDDVDDEVSGEVSGEVSEAEDGDDAGAESDVIEIETDDVADSDEADDVDEDVAGTDEDAGDHGPGDHEASADDRVDAVDVDVDESDGDDVDGDETDDVAGGSLADEDAADLGDSDDDRESDGDPGDGDQAVTGTAATGTAATDTTATTTTGATETAAADDAEGKAGR